MGVRAVRSEATRGKVKALGMLGIHRLTARTPVIGLAVGDAKLLGAGPQKDVFIQTALCIAQGGRDLLITNAEFKVSLVVGSDFDLYLVDASSGQSHLWARGSDTSIHVVAIAWPLTAIATDAVAVATVRAIAIFVAGHRVARWGHGHPAMAPGTAPEGHCYHDSKACHHTGSGQNR